MKLITLEKKKKVDARMQKKRSRNKKRFGLASTVTS